MGDIDIKAEEIVQLVRLGLLGDARQISAFAKRIARKNRKMAPETSDMLIKAITETPTSDAGQFRRAQQTHSPSDLESRHELLTTEIVADDTPNPTLTNSMSEELENLVLEQQNIDKLMKAGLAPARTALFVGPPGVGKTMTAHWLAKRLNRKLCTLNLAAVSSSLLGRTGTNIRDALEFAKSSSSILLLDEFDAIAKRRDDRDDVGEMKRIVTVLLQEIDRWPSNSLLIAATNHGDLLDPAIWRRFDLTIEFPVANSATSHKAFEAEFSGSIASEYIDLLAEIHSGKPFSDITKFTANAQKQAILKDLQIADVVHSLIERMAVSGDKKQSKKLALKMVAAGFSQRKASEFTGISRDTIRKEKANS